ncbi:MAG: putative DNA binding domain-containing protein [Anaerolineales bacterium]|nr:putative DNA binding domain-containing protein [Chloroflexota bacterium]MBL7161294.1 putative DNA binding domain-containing protein [Anaerolineales bacterium]
MDLHLHTPASSDYQQPNVSSLDILKRAEAQGLDMVAITDHNTVAGYRRMNEEIQQLEMLKGLNRLLPEEKSRLDEYHRLLGRVMVLPGFEFTATFGFHILAVFSPDKPLREIEHILLDLNIPADQLDKGSVTVGASADVLAAYEKINAAGGLAIAAHANSTNGVAMRGFRFGGQTKIAYTQDPNLHALEVTDLDRKGRHSTAGFFSGTKPEYPRRMHCIQGSDAHRVENDSDRRKNLGVGDRATDVRLANLSFEALKSLFLGNDFARTRPHRHKAEAAFDFIQAASEEGANIVQDFHESMTVRGGKLYAVIADVCAFANTNGGTIYIGMNRNPQRGIGGVASISQEISRLEKEISDRISPELTCSIDAHKFRSKDIIRVLVPRGDDPPYAVDDSKIYLRTESETGMAVRDEIVEMVLRGQPDRHKEEPITQPEGAEKPLPVPPADVKAEPETEAAPRTGVEIVTVEERQGVRYYTVRDLRNNNVVKNVTRKSARKLWHYAVTQYDKVSEDPQSEVKWQGDLGLLNIQKIGNFSRYDLIQRDAKGNYRFYFGVTEDGIDDNWQRVIGISED